MENSEISSDNGPLTPEEKARALTDLLVKQLDEYLGYRDLSRALDAIIFGRTLNKIKVCVKEARIEGGWRGYIRNHLSPPSERTVQNWTYLAKNPHCHDYVSMGEDRLLKAARCAKKYGGDDPIGTFLKEEKIAYIVESSLVSAETKKRIDEAIAKARRQTPKKSEVNLLAGRLINQLHETLEDAEFLATVDDGKLEALEATIKDVRAQLCKK